MVLYISIVNVEDINSSIEAPSIDGGGITGDFKCCQVFVLTLQGRNQRRYHIPSTGVYRPQAAFSPPTWPGNKALL